MGDKKTLMNIREEGKHHIDIPDLSAKSGVSEDAIRRMLLDYPVTLVEAQLLLLALSEATGERYSLDTIAIAVDSESSDAPCFHVPALRAQKPFINRQEVFETYLEEHGCRLEEYEDHYKVFPPMGTKRQERRQEDNGVTLFHLIFPDGTRIPEYIDFTHIAPYSRLGFPASSLESTNSTKDAKKP